MKTLAVIVLAAILVGCSAPLPSPTPSPSQTAAPVSTDTLVISCGPYANDVPDCLAIVVAAAKVAPVPIVPGTRADVSNRAAARLCAARPACIELAASAILVHVVFTTPTGEQGSADVVTNPLGAYTGVDPKHGP